ncbi:phosphotransferase [Sagittula sp. NFXS13]|uniref:phosphotransferase n=1 Tax=Sagittula sp. NFXS13 TaxID=2819095 RepID=UPI0032DF8FC9
MNDVVILTDERLVAALMQAQGGDWAGQEITSVEEAEGERAMYRVGSDFAVRMPRHPDAVSLIEREARWLPHLSGLPLAMPSLRLRGEATPRFNWPFIVLDWIGGTEAQESTVRDWSQEVALLARFLRALWKRSLKGGPAAGPENRMRGVPLHQLTDTVLTEIGTLREDLDVALSREVWMNALEAAPPRKMRWLHGNLKASNMIVRDGKLAGVVDWGHVAVGDPAVDVAVAWRWVPELEMGSFQSALSAGDDLWRRARGWALYDAVSTLGKYRGSNHPRHIIDCDDARCVIGRLGLGTSC